MRKASAMEPDQDGQVYSIHRLVQAHRDGACRPWHCLIPHLRMGHWQELRELAKIERGLGFGCKRKA